MTTQCERCAERPPVWRVWISNRFGWSKVCNVCVQAKELTGRRRRKL